MMFPFVVDSAATSWYTIYMKIINQRTSKRTKLHFFKCPICKEDFGSYRNTSKVCSKKCSHLLNGILKYKSTQRKCVVCSTIFLHRPSDADTHRFCSKKCQNHNKKFGLPTGKYFSYDGYIVLVRTPDGRKQIKEHRYIMEQHLGRKLLPTEIVHHINEKKTDNRLENLLVVSRREHNRIHGRG